MAIVRRARPLLGTIVAVTASGADPRHLDGVIGATFAEMQRLQAVFSEWDPASVVNAVAADAGRLPVAVPPEFLEVMQLALEIAERSGGAFDPSWAVLAEVWDFHAECPRVPSAEEIARCVSLVNYRDVVLDASAGTVLLRRPGMRLGLGAVAKGYIADRGAELAIGRRIQGVLIDAGGDVVARGDRGDRPWVVAIRDPRRPGVALGALELRDSAVATSGDAERSFVAGGRRWHHVLDPRTGRPAGATGSVTVVAPRAAEADALATALFVLGPVEGASLIAGMPGVAAAWVRRQERRPDAAEDVTGTALELSRVADT